jgi:HK97 family phage prohead protease
MELSELSTTNYEFAGRATCANVLCSDGRTILPDAFKHQDGEIVPLIWNHRHEDVFGVLGSALLHSRNGDIYAYCAFNETEQGQAAREVVRHGDTPSLSICANQLRHNDKRGVMHGVIREVSLVIAGANPKAKIESVRLMHSEDGAEYDEEIHVYTGEGIELFHSDEKSDKEDPKVEDTKNPAPDTGKEKTIKQIYDEMTEEQQAVCQIMVGQALEDAGVGDNDNNEDDNKEETNMKHNVFDNDSRQDDTLMHADIINNAIADGKRFGTLKESILAHAAENNITDIQELFPNEHDLHMPPEWYKENDDSWVAKVMRSVHHVPFSRVRALFAKMDEATARAHGYIKGNEKQVGLKLSILKRTTKPTTVYIKMAMDRDDLVDIQYDALPWIRAEGRKVLDAELARAYLLGDGRDPGEDDKIDELCIRPILTDDPMYTITYTVTDGKDFHNDFNSASENDSEAKGVIRGAIKARKGYKGSGNVTFFTTEDLVTELLLIEDQNGRRIYESEAALCTALRCKEIVPVPELEQEKYADVYGIFVNMNDYQVGADKGGQVTTFEDFDIDYNKEKILMETRCSAALVKPKSAIVLKKQVAAAG